MPPNLKPDLILIVDDSPEDRTTIQLCLAEAVRGAGLQLRFQEASNGAEGLAVYRAETPACIMLDYNLPDMTGLDFLAHLGGTDGAIPLPVVMLTGSCDTSLAIGALQAGAQEYLPKRLLEPEMLLRAVQAAQSRFTLQAERRSIEAALSASETLLRLSAERALYEQKLEKSNTELKTLARDLERARDTAERANRAKTRFLAGMSHELRTPLHGILGYAQLLNLDSGLTAEQSTRVLTILEAGAHLMELIQCVLDLSEIENEHAEVQAVAVDLRRVAAACLDLLRPTAAAKNLALGLFVEPEVPLLVMSDPTRLRQVLINLLANAVKFTPRGLVQLRVLIAANPANLRFEVADTGPGIPAAQRHRLFQHFERLGTDPTKTIEGAGLGLFLSAQFVKLMGGQSGYEDNPGGGSVFWLELPLIASNLAAAPADATTHPPIPAAPVAPPALHVLVVDDVAMNRDIAGSFLRAAGLKVTYAEGGAEAVTAAAITDYDVVLMDVRMPVVDGLEATRRIRMLPTPRGQVPVVALTAQAFTEQVAECRRAGMDGHLAKPYDPEMLLAAVTGAMEAGRARLANGH